MALVKTSERTVAPGRGARSEGGRGRWVRLLWTGGCKPQFHLCSDASPTTSPSVARSLGRAASSQVHRPATRLPGPWQRRGRRLRPLGRWLLRRRLPVERGLLLRQPWLPGQRVGARPHECRRRVRLPAGTRRQRGAAVACHPSVRAPSCCSIGSATTTLSLFLSLSLSLSGFAATKEQLQQRSCRASHRPTSHSRPQRALVIHHGSAVDDALP